MPNATNIDPTGRTRQADAARTRANDFGLDSDTIEFGTQPPFASWEGDHTELYHVLRNAHREGLTVERDADRIAGLIESSRWFTAAVARANTRALADDERKTLSDRHHEFIDGRTVAEIEGRADVGAPLEVSAMSANPLLIRVGDGASVRAKGGVFVGTVVEVGSRVKINLI